MRTLKWLLAVAVLPVLSACGGGSPRHYYITVNRGALEALPATCYSSGTAPTNTDRSSNMFEFQQWSVWDGTEGKLYLVVGSMSVFDLGDAPNVSITGDAIEGGPLVFTTTRETNTTTGGANPTTVNRKLTTTVTFTELGGSAKGTLTLSSQTTCTGAVCPTPATPNCNIDLPFVGRKIEGSNEIVYVPGP